MQLTDAKKKELLKKILFSRLRILNDYGFYGLLLMHMNFGLDLDCQTAYTDGYKIAFSPAFLESLTALETDFIMMHEIMHVCLKHCFRGSAMNQFMFNVACDIVVNSNILKSHNMDLSSISINGVDAMHLTPKGDEGYNYTAEEVYEMLIHSKNKAKLNSKGNIIVSNAGKTTGNNIIDESKTMDDHTHWATNDVNQKIDEWDQRLINVLEASRMKNNGSIPLAALREYDKLTDATVDWRLLLKEFISFEISDYSFNPPDRRYSDYDFYLPDFNELGEVTDINVLFEIDTSSSMTNKDLALAYSEIKGAIEAYDKIKGWLGFYDTECSDIKPFMDVDDMLKIKPRGGGGTDCSVIFKSLGRFEHTIGNRIDAIIIITDGYDTFPKESVRKNIPVFWIITNKDNTPPWGVVARIKSSK